MTATENTEVTEGVAPPTYYCSRNTQVPEEKFWNENKVLQHNNTEYSLLTLLTPLTYFHGSLECCRALNRKRMKTNTTDLRSIEAPLAEGEEEQYHGW